MELEMPPSDDEWSGPDSPDLRAQDPDRSAYHSLPNHYYFHIRCSAQLFVDDNSFNPIFKEFCDNHFSRYIMVLENPDLVDKTPHIHIHGESCVVSTYKQMFAAWHKYKMPVGGNKVYGIKAPDPSNPNIKKDHVPPNWLGYVYVCKGTRRVQPDGLPDVKGVKQFTSTDICNFHADYWEKVHVKPAEPEHDPNAVVVDTEGIPEVKPRRQYISWTEKTINDIRAMNPDKQWNHIRDRRILVEYIMNAMGKKGRALDAMIFRRIYWSIYNALPKTEADTNRLYDQFDSYLDAMC